MDVADLKMVVAICEEGSLTRAADILFVSQPTLSKRLARLEQRLNATLFHRDTTGLKPTAIADFLVASARPLEDRLAAIERQVEPLRSRLDDALVDLVRHHDATTVIQELAGGSLTLTTNHLISAALLAAGLAGLALGRRRGAAAR